MKKTYLEANAARRCPKGFGMDARELYEQGFEDGARWLKRAIKKEMKLWRNPLGPNKFAFKPIDKLLRRLGR